MYIYKRFKASKRRIAVIVIALARVAWGILGLTGTPLAKKGGGEKVTFDVELVLEGKSFHGRGFLAGLGVNFFITSNPKIMLGGVQLKLREMRVDVRAREVSGAYLFFEGDDGSSYKTDYDFEPDPWLNSIPVDYVEGEVSVDTTGFTIHLLDASAVPVCRHSRGRGKKEGIYVIGTVDVGDPVFTPIE